MPFLKSFPEDADTGEIFRRHPGIYQAWFRFVHALKWGKCQLTEGERELISAYVSGLNSCEYCYGGHKAAAAAWGLDEGMFTALMDDIDTAPVDERLKPILRYVRKLTKEPAKMTQTDADAVFNAGWDERTLHIAIGICAVSNFMNRVVFAFGIPAIPEKFAERGSRHKNKGYLHRLDEVTGRNDSVASDRSATG